MGFGEGIIGPDLRERISKLRIPMYKRGGDEPRVYFSDVVLACARRIVEDELKGKGATDVYLDLPAEHRANKAWKKKFKKLKHVTDKDIVYNIQHYAAVYKLLSAYHCYKFRKQMLRQDEFSPKSPPVDL